MYGDWAALREAAAPGMVPSRIDADVRQALAIAADDPTRLTDAEALALLHADGDALDALCADRGRRAHVGWWATT